MLGPPQCSLVAGLGFSPGAHPLAGHLDIAVRLIDRKVFAARIVAVKGAAIVTDHANQFVLNARLELRLIDLKILTERTIPFFVVVSVPVGAFRRLRQIFRYLAVLDAVERVVVTNAALRVFIQGYTYVVPTVLYDDARLAVGDDAAPNASRDAVVLL